MTSNWFSFNGRYTNAAGLSAKINGEQMQLSRADVDFLLLEVDPKVANASAHPGMVRFKLHEREVVVSIEDWWTFQDHLTSVVGEGGWDAFGDRAANS